MNLEPIRQVFRPLFGLERRETTTRFLYAILISAAIIDLLMILIRLLSGESFLHPTILLLAILLLFLVVQFLVVQRGYVSQAALMLVAIAWLSVTYQAWIADGIRDASIFAYVLIMLIAALLTNWYASVALSVLSIIAIWFFAFAEAAGSRVLDLGSPLNMARDLTAIFIILFLVVYLVINAFRQSLKAVQEGEEKFRRVFHVSPVAIAIASLEEGRLLDANDAYWRLTGFDPALALGKTTIELGSWSSEVERERFVNQIKEQRSIHNPSYTSRNQYGEQRTTLAFYELIDFERAPAILAMLYDITDQKNAQLALQESEEKYRNFIEQSMEGIWFVAFDPPISIHLPAEEQVRLMYKIGYISECNDVLARMYGYQFSTELVGKHLVELQDGDEINEISYQATLKLVMDGYRSGNRETQEHTREGKTVYFLNNAVGVIKDDCLVGLWGTQLDITTLKNTEAALRSSEARTRALLNAIPDMIFEFQRDGTILQFISSSVNRPLLPPEQFLGKTIQSVLPASVADQTIFAIRRVLDSGQVHAFEYQLFQDNENKVFEARITPLGADRVLAIVRDVSLQKWILGEREQLINELERKNAELERFTYTASHDLKSPLITIKGFLGFLQKDAESGNLKRLESDIQRIGAAADKMQRLLNDLLELSRIGRMVNPPLPVDLNQMITEVLELVHGRIYKGNIRVSVEQNLPQVYGDRPRLLEVWQNLIDNAAKFMGSQPDPHIEIGQAEKPGDDSPIFFVRDNGMGIDPRFKDRIFGLFDKLDPHSEGTGVGLALVKRIVEFHGGRIWVESVPGHGTTFYFTLPQPENSSLNSD